MDPALIRRRALFGLWAALILCPLARAAGGEGPFDPDAALDACDVVWREPGRTSADSMPLGNGDIGLNVWTEAGGDVVFLIGKTDAWTEDPAGTCGLAKLGRIRLSLTPNPYATAAPFRQRLRLRRGEIEIREGAGPAAATIRIWVDANHPVIRAEVDSARPVSLRAALEDWRTTSLPSLSADTVLPSQKDRIAWYHHDGAGSNPHVAGWTFGAIASGPGLATAGANALVSVSPKTTQLVSVFPLTAPRSSPGEWRERLERQIASLDGATIESTRRAHRQWWEDFWRRSWIFLRGGAGARATGKGYILQRFVTACAGRGAFPIKFNGSLFVVDRPAEMVGHPPVSMPVTADYRMWGGRYWFQNTRAMYWPRLMAGDFDEMLPLFAMYRKMLPGNAALVRQYYRHAGAYCAETSPFWGGLKDLAHNGQGYYGDNYYTDLLELTMMGLDYCDYTGDDAFRRDTVLPIAAQILAFFDQHFPRDAAGKLVLDPDNALETYWKVRNPAPDIAGLRAILPRLLALPQDAIDPGRRRDWDRILAELPVLPTGKFQGRTVLLPCENAPGEPRHNSENPELYAIYPFRLYGLGQPGLELARDTFAARKVQAAGCWVQDPIQAALLGLPGLAQRDTTFDLTRQDPGLKFPAFWIRGNDYMPDEDNGGNGENALQHMLLQAEGRALRLLPAWPKDWDADFKLHAPFQTTVEGSVRGGRLVLLTVTPRERRADVTSP